MFLHIFCKIKSPNTLSLELKFITPYNNKYTNNMSILKVWAEMVFGRNGHGPIWLWAEMTSDPCLSYDKLSEQKQIR